MTKEQMIKELEVEFGKIMRDHGGCMTDNEIAMSLVELGYRKADEVRKETAKEFIDFANNMCHNYYPSIDNYCVSQKAVPLKDIRKFAREYGVEVEE